MKLWHRVLCKLKIIMSMKEGSCKELKCTHGKEMTFITNLNLMN